MTSPRTIERSPDCPAKAALGAFLARNPYPSPRTTGFFYREKMRALHDVTPDERLDRILDIGGGRSGITALLYPDAEITTLDLDPSHGDAPCNNWPGVAFVCASAVDLPFPDASFDAVFMFDLLEHVEDDGAVAREVSRVVRAGGWIVVSTPKDTWRFPHYRVLAPICRSEEDLFAEWGHVRRGYALAELERLFGGPPTRLGSFGVSGTALGHDITFSKLGDTAKALAWLATSPVTIAGYLASRRSLDGNEHVAAWRKG